MRRVLWVDDEAPNTLSALADLLRSRGLEIDVAADVKTASHMLREHKYDAALLDIALPVGAGLITATSYLGLEVARSAAESGIRSVLILTVVREEEALERFEALKNDHPSVSFTWIDKMTLLEGNVIDHMVTRLLE